MQWLPGYSHANLRPDLLAGLTAAAVVVPQAMAYASIARLPVQVGLYTALVPMLICFLLGTSRVLSVSTTSTLAMLSAAALAPLALSGGDLLSAASMLALLVGVILLLAALFKLGFIANFISLPVLTGFKAGMGVVIFGSQHRKKPKTARVVRRPARNAKNEQKRVRHSLIPGECTYNDTYRVSGRCRTSLLSPATIKGNE